MVSIRTRTGGGTTSARTKVVVWGAVGMMATHNVSFFFSELKRMMWVEVAKRKNGGVTQSIIATQETRA